MLAAQHAARPETLKRLDVERDLTPTGSSASAWSATCSTSSASPAPARRARHLDYLGGARRDLPAPHAVAAARGRQRRRLRDRRLPRRAPRPRHGRRPAGRLRGRPSRARHQPGARPCSQPRRARAPWAVAARAGDRRYRDYFYVFGDRTMPDALRGDSARGVPRLRPRQLHLGRRARRLGVDVVQLLPVGPELVEPRRVRSSTEASCCTWRTWASTSFAWTPSRSSGSAWAPTARTSPRCTP
jgi:hypothetical protein